MSAYLRAERLTRRLGGEVPVTLIDDVSLEVARGEFVAVMGPSGCGKSSLLYLLGLLDVPTSGRVLMDGEDTSGFDENRLAELRLQRLGFVFQFHFLLAEFTALDNVLLPMRKLGALDEAKARTRAMGLLDELGVAEQARKRPDQMSGGQRQRVAIARALANDPTMLLADEPTGNLDSVSSATVRDILANLARDHAKTVIVVTHDEQFASAAGRRILLLDGRLDGAAQARS